MVLFKKLVHSVVFILDWISSRALFLRTRAFLAHSFFLICLCLCLQEHTVLLIARLLSPAIPTDFSGSESHLIGYAPLLNVLLVGISSVDCIQIFSLHGMVGLFTLKNPWSSEWQKQLWICRFSPLETAQEYCRKEYWNVCDEWWLCF